MLFQASRSMIRPRMACTTLAGGCPAGIDVGHDIAAFIFALGVVVQNGFALLFVGANPLLDHFVVRVIKPVVLERALAQTTRPKFGTVRAAQVKHLQHLNVLLHVLGLLHIPRNAVQHEKIDVRLETVGLVLVVDVGAPQFHRGLILAPSWPRLEKATKLLSKRGSGVQGPEHITASHVVKARDRSQHFTLCPLPAAGRAEHQGRCGIFERACLTFLTWDKNAGSGIAPHKTYE